MKTNDGFIQGYNCQAAVDEAHQIIVAQAVTNQPPDVEHFIPMMEQVASNCGEMPHSSSADAGYFSETNAEWALNQGIDRTSQPADASMSNRHRRCVADRGGT
jgi:hypothetical protein